MSIMLDLINAQKDKRKAEQNIREAKDAFVLQQKIRLFEPIKIALRELKTLGLHRKGCGDCYEGNHIYHLDPDNELDRDEIFTFSFKYAFNGGMHSYHSFRVRDDLKGFEYNNIEYVTAIEVLEKFSIWIAHDGGFDNMISK